MRAGGAPSWGLWPSRCVAARAGGCARAFGGGAGASGKKKKPQAWPPVNLPQTEFPMRANAAAREPGYLARCTTELYAWQLEARKEDRSPFVLHDGPPYANGPPHVGHALNKVRSCCCYHYAGGWS